MIASVMAGGVFGIAGLAAFLTIHALWITPIWFIAAPGAAIAAAGGGCVGLAYHVHRHRLPDRLLGRGLAAAAFAVGIGHIAPFIGQGAVAVKMWTIMLSVTAVAALALATLQARLTTR